MATALATAVDTTQASAAPLRLLRLPEVLGRVGVGRSQWYAMVAAGQAPQPVHVGRAVTWAEHEVTAWIAERLAARKAA